ncbi:MAG: Na/Pi cotransporter family protein [Clostridia bacterium]|nr:Na/Pi cotransporter family protein [Clostridia bacterium]
MTTMDILTIVIEILAGCGAFLLGFKVLSDNMEKIAGNGLRKLFNKTSDKRALNVAMGAAATAVVQSSSITTVMIIGFVNAGIMTLYQAAALIMGANIGTTITGQIAALQAFDIDLIFMLMLFVGVFMDLFSKNDRVKSTGLALAGLGLVFVGLGLMSDPMSALKESKAVTDFLAKVDNSILLLLIGIGLTAIIQSSSAVTTIVISMAGAGLVIGDGGNAPLFIILGSNIGTCVTAMISSIGTNLNAKRTSIIHLLFNVIGSLIFTVMLLIWKNFSTVTLEKWFSSPSTQIAMFHTIFNVTCTLLFLPFTKNLVKLAILLVPSKKSGEASEDVPASEVSVTYMDKRFIATPALAISQLKKETFRMADIAMESLEAAIGGFLKKDLAAAEVVQDKNERVAKIGSQVSDYLVQVSASGISLADEKLVRALHSDVGDVVRISELADNVTKYTRREVSENLVFSAVVADKIAEMHGLLCEQYKLVKRIILDKEYYLLSEADKLEEEIDEMRRALIADHIARMERGECRPENNGVFINLVSNLERIGDHINYIAHSRDAI